MRKEQVMMDITKISGNILSESGASPKTAKADGSFGNILEEAQKGQTSQVAHTPALGPPMPVNPVADMDAMAVQQADRLLGLLEKYAQNLENPGVSLKSMGSMVEQMELEANAARRVLSHMDSQGDLGSLVNKAAVQASVEAFKFRRGDYV